MLTGLAQVHEHPELPGWEIKTSLFDFGTKWGVAVDNGKAPPHRRRFAVRVPDPVSEAEAIELAIPVLKGWILERE
jgi:hypothetical protein